MVTNILKKKDLSDRDRKYQSVLESIDQGYFEIDLSGNIVFFNDPFRKIIGLPAEELSGMNFFRLLDRENTEKVRKVLDQVFHSGNPDRGFVWEYIRKDGSIRKIGSSVSILFYENGEPYGYRGIARDISERKILEDELVQSRKMEAIGRLAAGIAHEINTPTQYVGDNTHFLKDAFLEIQQLLDKYESLLTAVVNGEAVEGIVTEIEALKKEVDIGYLSDEIPIAIHQSLEGLERVSNIVQAMKVFSHPGVGRKIPVDINQAIESTIIIARNEWKYVAEMDTNFDSSLPPIPCIPGEFNQVILNLIINAAHAVSENAGTSPGKKGKISVTTRLDNEYVEIRISDTGPGIPVKARPMIFDPFFTTKAPGKGTGQGLAIAHTVIVKKHSGSIRFETELGKGTIFIMRLPVHDPD